MLREVRGPGAGVDDVEALAQIMDFAAGFNTSTQDWADDISSVILRAEGPFTLLLALPEVFAAYFGGPPLPEFGDVGFHLSLRDRQNQPYHWWGYVNTVVQGGYGGILLGQGANSFHEFADPFEVAKSPEKRGASWQDYALSLNGMGFGYLLYNGTITPDNAGDTARIALRADYRSPALRALSELIGNDLLPPNLIGRGLDHILGR